MRNVKICIEGARWALTQVETGFNWAGYCPVAVHRVSGGVRMVYGCVETVTAVALGVLVTTVGWMNSDKKLREEGVEILGFALHGVANMVRGFIETRKWVHLIFIVYDWGVPEKYRFVYPRPVTQG